MAVVIPLKLVYTPVDATVTAIRNYQVPSTNLAAGSLAQEAPLHAFSHSKTLWQFISVAELCEFGLGINSKWQSSQ